MDYLPIFALVRGRRCLVVGGGSVAARKVELLCQAGAEVCVVSPRLSPELRRHAAAQRIEARARAYRTSDLDGVALAIAATDSQAVNAQVAADAARRNLFVNVVDDKALSSFIVPSIVDRSPLIAAVSSSGASPVLARLVRAQLEQLLSPAHGELARFAERHREQVRARLPELPARRAFWEQLLSGPVGEWVLQGRVADAEHALAQALADGEASSGELCLIECTSDELDLLSLRAARLLSRADVVLYEPRLEHVSSLARRDARREALLEPAPAVAFGTRAGALVREGKRVCVLHAPSPQWTEAERTLRAEGVAVRALGSGSLCEEGRRES